MSNSKYDYIEQQTAVCRDSWFKHHQAKVLVGAVTKQDATVIEWRNPESWNYGCRFIIHSRWLIVVGDIGEAVFEFGSQVDTEFLSGLELHYLMGKCQASEEGKHFEMFNADVGAKQAKEWLATERQENAGEAEPEWFEMVEELGNHTTEEELEEAFMDIYKSSEDSESASMVRDWFYVPHVRAIGMAVGLKMALQQLRQPITKPA